MLETPLQPDEKNMFGMRCCMAVVSVAAWTFALLLEGLYMERSETVVGNACPFRCASFLFASRVSRTSAPSPTGRVRAHNVAHHVLGQSMFMELNIIHLFGGGCGVLCASAGDSIDSTCSATLVRCAVRGSSSPMSQVASPTSMTFSRIRREPRRCSAKRRQISTICSLEIFQHGSDHRSVALPFHLRVRVFLSSGHRTAHTRTKRSWVARRYFDRSLTEAMAQATRWRRCCSRWLCKSVFLSRCLLELHDCCSRGKQMLSSVKT